MAVRRRAVAGGLRIPLSSTTRSCLLDSCSDVVNSITIPLVARDTMSDTAQPRYETQADFPGLTKRIWLLWAQGLDRAPPVPRACIDSWFKHNPDWEITLLNAETLRDWANPVLCEAKARSLPSYRLSELARVDLLARYGGVWADATCYCMKPLNDWLPSCLRSRFFAFARPGRDRVMSSWFLASRPGGHIPHRMWDALRGYYLDRDLFLDSGWQGSVSRQLARAFNSNPYTTALWFAPPLPQLGITTYFSFHYMFASLTWTDRAFRDIWRRTVKVSAVGPHTLMFHGFGEPPSQEILTDIETRRVPLYKLNWRIDPGSLPKSSTLNTLLGRDRC